MRVDRGTARGSSGSPLRRWGGGVGLVLALLGCGTEDRAIRSPASKPPPTSESPFVRRGNGWRLEAEHAWLGYRFRHGQVTLWSGAEGARRRLGAMRLAGLGRRCGTPAPRPVKEVRPRGNALEYVRAQGVVERFVARAGGLEQAFLLREPPPVPASCGADEARQLELALQLTGLEVVEVNEEGAVLASARGEVRVAYGKLAVFDGRGRRLPASLGAAEGTLQIRVDARGAEYPIYVDPIIAGIEAKLQMAQPSDLDLFGTNLAMHRNVIAVQGGARDDMADNTDARVHVFQRRSGSWIRMGRFRPRDLTYTDSAFAKFLAVWGDTVLAGGGVERGYVYRQNPDGAWGLEARLMGSDVSDGDRAGTEVALWQDTAVLGVSFGGAEERNAVYVFRRREGEWKEQTKISPQDLPGTKLLSGAVALFRDSLVVGGLSDTEAPVVAVLTRSSGTWSYETTLALELRTVRFAHDLAFARDVIVAGAPIYGRVDGDVPRDAGAVCIFERESSEWTRTTTLRGQHAEQHFGDSVDVEGDVVVVGAPRADDPPGRGTSTNRGAAFFYRRGAEGWELARKWKTEPTLRNGPGTGHSVAISQGRAVVGAPAEDTPEATSTGAAYVLKLRGQGGFMSGDAGTGPAEAGVSDGAAKASDAGDGMMDTPPEAGAEDGAKDASGEAGKPPADASARGRLTEAGCHCDVEGEGNEGASIASLLLLLLGWQRKRSLRTATITSLG